LKEIFFCHEKKLITTLKRNIIRIKIKKGLKNFIFNQMCNYTYKNQRYYQNVIKILLK